MDANELTEMLNGCQIGDEVSKAIEQMAKENNLVIVFGASDDLMEFRGDIDDELDAYEGTTAYIDGHGLIINKCDSDDCPYHKTDLVGASAVKAIWCATDEYSWTFETKIPHETFDIIEEPEDEENHKYCRGIVFSMLDIN